MTKNITFTCRDRIFEDIEKRRANDITRSEFIEDCLVNYFAILDKKIGGKQDAR